MNSRFILWSGGLVLLLAGAVYGLAHAVCLGAGEPRSGLYNLEMALNMAAVGKPGLAEAYAGQFVADSARRVGEAQLALQLISAGTLAVALLAIQDRLVVSERLKSILASFIVLGGAGLALGDWGQLTAWPLLGHYVAILGYAWLGLGLAGYAIYSLLHIFTGSGKTPPGRN